MKVPILQRVFMDCTQAASTKAGSDRILLFGHGSAESLLQRQPSFQLGLFGPGLPALDAATVQPRRPLNACEQLPVRRDAEGLLGPVATGQEGVCGDRSLRCFSP